MYQIARRGNNGNSVQINRHNIIVNRLVGLHVSLQNKNNGIYILFVMLHSHLKCNCVYWANTDCLCVDIPFILDVIIVDAPAGVTQQESHTGFLIHLPSAVLALLFITRRIQPSVSLVDREVEFCLPTN